MAGNGDPSSFKKPEAELVIERDEPDRPQGQLESKGDSQVTSARSSSAAPSLSVSIGRPEERRPQEITPSPPELSPLPRPLSFQMGLPETKIVVERSLTVFVSTDVDYSGKPWPRSEESSGEGSLLDRSQSDPPHPKARSGILAVSRPIASGSSDLDISLPQSASKPETISPTIWQSKEISETLEKATNVLCGVVGLPNPSAAQVKVSCIKIIVHEGCTYI